MKHRGLRFSILLWMALTATALCTAADPVAAEPAAGQPSGSEQKQESLTDINKKMTNPVTDLWIVPFQENNYVLGTLPGHEDRWNSNLLFQPVLPVGITKDWNLITRPVVTLFNSMPYPSLHVDPNSRLPRVDIKRTTAFGDTTLMEMISPTPSLVGNWILGLGPTFIFPTAESDYTGQGKWQAGPAAVVGYLSKKWLFGVFVQNWTSFAGNSDRSDTNQMNLQPLLVHFLPEGWSVGYSGNILANWEADGGDMWTVPIGLGVGKVLMLGRLPIKVNLSGQYMPVHPDEFGQKWNIQLNVTVVIPKLIKGTLFD